MIVNREIRIYRFLCQNPGWQSRDKIMHWTGYCDPKRYPVIAYVEFQNDVMRLNARLAREGKQVVRFPNFDKHRSEVYSIISIDQKAA